MKIAKILIITVLTLFSYCPNVQAVENPESINKSYEKISLDDEYRALLESRFDVFYAEELDVDFYTHVDAPVWIEVNDGHDILINPYIGVHREKDIHPYFRLRIYYRGAESIDWTAVKLTVDDIVYHHELYDWEIDAYVQEDGLICEGNDFIRLDRDVWISEAIFAIKQAENVTLELLGDEITLVYEFDLYHLVIFDEVFDYFDGILLPDDITVFNTGVEDDLCSVFSGLNNNHSRSIKLPIS